MMIDARLIVSLITLNLSFHSQIFAFSMSMSSLERREVLTKFGSTCTGFAGSCIGISFATHPSEAYEDKAATQSRNSEYKDAVESLLAQRLASDDINNVILDGKMDEARFKVINLIPQVTSAGQIVLKNWKQETKNDFGKETETSNDVSLIQLQMKLDRVLVMYTDTSRLIEQGLRGQMGALTVTQLQSLSSLKTAQESFDDFLNIAILDPKDRL